MFVFTLILERFRDFQAFESFEIGIGGEGKVNKDIPLSGICLLSRLEAVMAQLVNWRRRHVPRSSR